METLRDRERSKRFKGAVQIRARLILRTCRTMCGSVSRRRIDPKIVRMSAASEDLCGLDQWRIRVERDTAR
jgi:hypothetical protein